MIAPAETDAPATWWSWLHERAADFLALVPRIYDLAHDAAVTSAEARAAGDDETAELARAAVPRIMALWRRAESLAGVVRRIGDAPAGLGTPWAVLGIGAATVVAVGLGVAWVYARYGAEAEIVDLLRQGLLTEDAAADLLEAVGDPPGSGLFAGIGGGVATMGAIFAAVLLWRARG